MIVKISILPILCIGSARGYGQIHSYVTHYSIRGSSTNIIPVDTLHLFPRTFPIAGLCLTVSAILVGKASTWRG